MFIDVKGLQPTIAILLLPENDNFERVELIALFIKDESIVDRWNFQLKSNTPMDKPPLPGFEKKSFLITDIPPDETYVDDIGWKVLDASRLKCFFGVPGRYWTPSVWRPLEETFECNYGAK
jgi:hypothetical protein